MLIAGMLPRTMYQFRALEGIDPGRSRKQRLR
jgi:hypothetical protein